MALACHLQLARLRPAASQLTDYYLWVSIGGVVGGLFCAVLAPLWFTGLTELPISLGACVALYAFVRYRRDEPLLDVLGSLIAVVLLAFVLLFRNAHYLQPLETSCLIGAVFVAACYWPARFAVAFVCYLAFFAFSNKVPGATVLFAGRNYYGSNTVVLDGNPARKRLINGTITHGMQFVDPILRKTPSLYFAVDGPLGQALLPTLDSHPNARIGVAGLGTGTEAAYGRPGMSIDFYELNPTIKRIATNPELFTYLKDSAARISVILGDARLSMTQAPDAAYDVIILDAFNSDAVPVHLLTKEAFELYLSKLKPDGIILADTSNRYLALAPYIAATAASAGLKSDFADDHRRPDLVRAPTTWMCCARSRDRLALIEGGHSLWVPYDAPPGTAGWTDDYSNVFRALKALNQ